MSGLEALGALSGAVAVWLTTRQNPWCWPVGLINLGVYVRVFHAARLYADMGLQVVYIALSLYGWYHWLHGGTDRGTLPVARAPRRALLAGGVAGLAASLLLGAALQHLTDAAVPFLDSALSAYSLLAQYLQARKWIENWGLWMAVDSVYVGLYLAKDLPLTALLYALFAVLAWVGLRRWRQDLAAREAP